MAEMNMPVETFSDSIYYMSTGFTKMFGYIGIGAAFIYTAYPQNRKKTASTIIPLVVTTCLAGITEPIDFMFIFAAPLLYLIHSCIAGLFMALLKVFGIIALWNGNLLATFITNFANADKTVRMPLMFVLGAVEILVYFVVFSFFIKKFNYHTPGREEEPSAESAGEISASAGASGTVGASASKAVQSSGNASDAKAVDKDMALNIIQGLGNKANISVVDNCITRLRVTLVDPSLLDESLINKTNHMGIVKKGNDIQIIYGLRVPEVREAVEEVLKTL